MLWLVSTLLLGLVVAGCVVTFIVSVSVPARRDAQLDVMADLLAAHLDLDALLGLLDGGAIAVEELGDAGLDRRGRSLLHVREALVRGHEQVQCSAVGADDSIHAPFLDGNIPDDGLHRAGDVIPLIVRGHEAARAALFKAHAEGD